MNKSMKMISLVLLIGALLVAVILTFIALGFTSPIPWILAAVLIGIPFYISRREQQHFAVWKDEYSVGIKSLDDDHRKLLCLINKLQTAVHYQTGEIFEKEALDELVAYTKYHFDREEKMLEEAGYPDLDDHKKTHKAMIAEVEGFVEAYNQKGHEALKEVAAYLKNWLIGHINGTDKEYSALLTEKGMS
ncbi:MAG: hemerythrin family protein [Thiotrichaceae bacterium]|nr:hemerythrin family protein [Thiotrichaceae bacterium]